MSSLKDRIRSLRNDANAVGDYVMAAICEFALTGDHGLYASELAEPAYRDLRTMTRDAALSECIKSLNEAEAAA